MEEELAKILLGGGGAAAALVLLGRWALKQVTLAALDYKSDAAHGAILNNLRDEVHRLATRIESLESRVTTLTSHLAVMRGHALEAFTVITSENPLTDLGRRRIIDAMTSIIKDD